MRNNVPKGGRSIRAQRFAALPTERISGATSMAGIFELKTTTSNEYHFVLKARNGEVILSSQRYQSKDGAENGIASVRTNAVLDERFETKVAKNGEPYFVLNAANGQVIGQSETYSSASAMKKGIASVKKNAPEAKFKDVSEEKAEKQDA